MKKKNEITFLKDLKSEMNTFRFSFLPLPLLISQSKILKLKKNSLFSLGTEGTQCQKSWHFTGAGNCTASPRVPMCVLEGMLSRFSEAKREEGIVPFPTPKSHTWSHLLSKPPGVAQGWAQAEGIPVVHLGHQKNHMGYIWEDMLLKNIGRNTSETQNILEYLNCF